MTLYRYLPGPHRLLFLLLALPLGSCSRGNYAFQFPPAPAGRLAATAAPAKILADSAIKVLARPPQPALAGPLRPAPRPKRRVGVAPRFAVGLLLKRARRLPAAETAAAHPAAETPGQDGPLPVRHRSRGIAALLAFFLGAYGAHLFYLGYPKRGTTYLALSIIGTLLVLVGFVGLLPFALFASGGGGYLALLLLGLVLLGVVSLLATADLIAILVDVLRPRDGLYNHQFFQNQSDPAPPSRP